MPRRINAFYAQTSSLEAFEYSLIPKLRIISWNWTWQSCSSRFIWSWFKSWNRSYSFT